MNRPGRIINGISNYIVNSNFLFLAYTKLAFEVKKIFEKLMKREFPPDVEIDDDDFFEVDQPTLKPTKFKKPKLITTPANISPSTPITHKKTSMSDSITPEFARAQMLQAQARMRQLHQSASLLQSANIRSMKPPIAMSPSRFSLSSGAIAKMTPAQMQSLLLKYPKSDFAPSLAKGIKVAGTYLTLIFISVNIANALYIEMITLLI